MAEAGVTLGAFPEQVIGGYPPEDLVQWRGFVDAQRRSLEAFAADTAGLPTVFVLGLAVPVQSLLFNAAAVVHRGQVLAYVPKEKLPTYNVFYEARTFSRGGPGLALDADGVPLGDHLFAFDFGTIGVEVCEDVWAPDGPMRRRCFSGAELDRERLGVALPHGRPRHAPRDAGHARRRQPDGARLRQRRRRPGRADLRRRRVHLPERTPGARGAALHEPVPPRPSSTSIARGDCAWSTPPGAPTASTSCGARCPCRSCASPAPRADTTGLAYPAPPGGSFFLPAPSPPPVDARDAALDDLFEALAVGVESYYTKTGAFRSLGLALSGGRDSMLTLLVAWRAAARILGPDGAAARQPHHHLLHADPAFAGRDPHGRARADRRARRRATRRAARRRLRPRGRGGAHHARRATAGRDDASERAGAPARPTDVELGQHLGRALPADRQT